MQARPKSRIEAWVRNDLGVCAFQGLGRNGPSWNQVARRITRDLHTYSLDLTQRGWGGSSSTISFFFSALRHSQAISSSLSPSAGRCCRNHLTTSEVATYNYVLVLNAEAEVHKVVWYHAAAEVLIQCVVPELFCLGIDSELHMQRWFVWQSV